MRHGVVPAADAAAQQPLSLLLMPFSILLALLQLGSGSDVAESKEGCKQYKLNQKKVSLFWVKIKGKKSLQRDLSLEGLYS